MIRLLTWRRAALLALLAGNGFAQAGAAVVAALAVEQAFSRLGAANSWSTIVAVAIALAAAGLLSAFLRGRERIEAERLGQSYCHDLRMHLFDRLTRMSPRSIRSRSVGSTALRFVGDLSAIRKWVSLGLARLTVGVTMIVATIAALIVLDPLLAAATGAAAALGGLGAIAQGPALRRATREARRRRSRLAGQITEAISAVGVVQANNAVGYERRRVRRRSRRLRAAMIDRARRLGMLQAIAEGTSSAAIGVLLVVALVAGLPGPQVAAAMTVVGLLVPQLRGLARVQEYRQQQQVALEAIRRFLDRPTLLTEPADPQPVTDGRGHLRLVGASVGALTDVDAEVAAGRTVAVVGPNGAGKSTLLAAIARLVDLERGCVELDGTDLSTVALADAHAAIGIAAPDLPLMKGSLRHNLTYRQPDASPEHVDAVIERCDLREMVDALPDGLDHRVAEGGSNLSSGQRQRVLLARAILGSPRLLLLDEADANLDAATASVVDRIVAAHDGTCVVVTHRLERIAVADEVWHLADGRLVERGRVEDVLRAGSRTAQLFALDRSERIEVAA